MAEHFADIKQAAVCGILAALQMYDPAVGAPFAAFQTRYMQDGVGDYIRKMCIRDRHTTYRSRVSSMISSGTR